MADIFLHFKNKFNRNPELVAVEPMIQQSLAMTEAEVGNYEQWKNSPNHISLINWLREQFMMSQNDSSHIHDGIDLFSTSATKGFRLHPALTRYSDNSVRHLFNYLKEQIQKENYRITLADTRIFGRGYWNETIHRYILKPESDMGYAFAQITLELLLKDDKLVNLKMDACVPNTDLPRPSDDFAEMMQALLA